MVWASSCAGTPGFGCCQPGWWWRECLNFTAVQWARHQWQNDGFKPRSKSLKSRSRLKNCHVRMSAAYVRCNTEQTLGDSATARTCSTSQRQPLGKPRKACRRSAGDARVVRIGTPQYRRVAVQTLPIAAAAASLGAYARRRSRSRRTAAWWCRVKCPNSRVPTG